MTSAKVGTIAVCLLMMAIGVWMIAEAIELPAPSMPGAPGPARLPVIFAALLCVVSAVLIVATLRAEGEPQLPLKINFAPIGLMAGTVLYLLLLPRLGFLATTAPWVFAAAFILGRQWLASLLAALVLTLGIYVTFDLILNVPFP